jgi:hypothetical protein
MIDIEYIRSFFPPTIARESRFDRYMLKEYLQLLILDHLATTSYINKYYCPLNIDSLAHVCA